MLASRSQLAPATLPAQEFPDMLSGPGKRHVDVIQLRPAQCELIPRPSHAYTRRGTMSSFQSNEIGRND